MGTPRWWEPVGSAACLPVGGVCPLASFLSRCGTSSGRVRLVVRVRPPDAYRYLVLHGHARVTQGGAPEILAELARTYLGPDVIFPPMPDPLPGFVARITVDRVSGLGPGGPAR